MERSTHRRGGEALNSSSSFSSSLLDAIYRSIDEGDTMETCRGTNRARNHGHESDLSSIRKLQYTTMEKCFTSTTVETKKVSTAVTEKVVLSRRDYDSTTTSAYDRRYFRSTQQQRDPYGHNSTSSSSESSYGDFSSSEADSVRFRPPKVAGRPPVPPIRPERSLLSTEMKKPKQESSNANSIRDRFRASKIYGELKKAKGPVSPGGRLASFLNTLFTSPYHPKKVKTTSSPAMTTSGGEDSTCSSASSYSRSCLSKTPSSRSKTANAGAKRSVRFYPISIIVGEDLRPCGQRCVYDDLAPMPMLPAVRVREQAAVSTEERKKAKETARDVIEREYNEKRVLLGFGDEDDEEDDDDDAASYSSSDLFELENLTAIGDRYIDELPVYETTHLGTNRAIAQGLIV